MELLAFQNHLHKFLTGIPSENLDGFHSKLACKLQKSFQPLTFKAATELRQVILCRDFCKEKKNWKQDQILLFVYLVDKAIIKADIQIYEFQSEIWEDISKLIPGKTSDNCMNKALTIFPTSISDYPWKSQEEKLLVQIIEKEGSKSWKKISLQLFQINPLKIFRTSKQCRQRYMCYLKPDLKKGFWSPEQDYQLITLFLKYGRKWSKMAGEISGRNQNAIKNRFFLLFEYSGKESKQYYSQFLRKVNRIKGKLEKSLKISTGNLGKVQCNSKNIQPPKICKRNSTKSIETTGDIIKIEMQVEKLFQFTDYQRYFAF